MSTVASTVSTAVITTGSAEAKLEIVKVVITVALLSVATNF